MPDCKEIVTAGFLVACGARLLISCVMSTLTVVLVMYCVSVYDADEASAGLVIGAFLLSAMVSRAVAGAFLSQVGQGRMLFASSLLLAVTAVLYLFTWDMASLMAVRILNGAAFGVASNAVTVVGSRLVPKDRFAEGLGYFTLCSTIASMVGPFASVSLFHFHRPESVFLLALFCASASVPLCFWLARRGGGTTGFGGLSGHGSFAGNHVRTPNGRPNFKLSAFIEAKALPVCAFCCLTSLCYSSVNAFLGSYAELLGCPWAASTCFAASGALVIATRGPLGRMMDVHGDKRMLLPLISLLASGFALLCTADSAPLLIAACLIASVGHSGIMSGAITVALRNSAPERLGQASATYYTFSDIGLGLGPMGMGFLAGLVGLRGMFGCCCALMTLAALVFALAQRRM